MLLLIGLLRLALQAATNQGYGFHRDELATIDDAQHLAWGYVAYPPVTPFIGRIALELFGATPIGVRFFSALAMSIVVVLAGLIAREFGAGRRGQILAALAVTVGTISWIAGTLFQYVAFDFLWWVTIAYFVLRRINTGDPRWWIAIGATIGLGMLTKYTMGFCALGVAVAVFATELRRDLRSRWLWLGAALSIMIFLPNLLWQVRHDFISLDFLQSIHARDVRIGRTDDFLLDQLRLAANPFTIPLWIAGLWFVFRRYRAMLWLAVVPFVLFLLARGRGYYTAPIYPPLLAAGAVLWERWIAGMLPSRARVAQAITWAALLVGGAMVAALGPYSPVNSRLWKIASSVNGDLKEEIGWPELAGTVAAVYQRLPAEERARAGILAGNYGEAGAINLYGSSRGLPVAFSRMNSYWLRGVPEPPPETVIVLGYDREDADELFQRCDVVAQVTNRYGVANEETTHHRDIFLCRAPRAPWASTWPRMRGFG